MQMNNKLLYGIAKGPQTSQCCFMNGRTYCEVCKLKEQIEELNKTISSLRLEMKTEVNESLIEHMRDKPKRIERDILNKSLREYDSKLTSEDNVLESAVDEEIQDECSKVKEKRYVMDSLLKKGLIGTDLKHSKYRNEVNLIWKEAFTKFSKEWKEIKQGILNELRTLKETQGRINMNMIRKIKETIRIYQDDIKQCHHSMKALEQEYYKLRKINSDLIEKIEIQETVKSSLGSNKSSPRIIAENEVSSSLKDLQQNLMRVREILINKIQLISTQLEESRNEILTKVKLQLFSNEDLDPLIDTKEQHSINSSLNDGSTELYYLTSEPESHFRTPKPCKRKERFGSAQRPRTEKATTGTLATKKGEDISEEYELSLRESLNESNKVIYNSRRK